MRGVTIFDEFFIEIHTFQPALPMRGVTQAGIKSVEVALFQPALPMRGVTLDIDYRDVAVKISTRTPHAGSDVALDLPQGA